MTEFRKYMHIERLGTVEVEDIEYGKCYIFPKIDGTNSSIWWDDGLHSGSRNRELSITSDNAGFMAAMMNDERCAFLQTNPHLTVYGEWLVPHSLRTYREEAWRTFYVFDVYDNYRECYLSYDEYSHIVPFECIPPHSIINNPTEADLLKILEVNSYLIRDGEGAGEGIVIKRYDYVNKFGRQTWAKMVRQEFKARNKKEFGTAEREGTYTIESKIAEKYITGAMIDKVKAKIELDCDGWRSKYIARLLQTVFYDLVNEEIWHILKEHKNPVIDFKLLGKYTTARIKAARPEVFQ